MANPRRRRRGRHKAEALGDFISVHVGRLQVLADALNGLDADPRVAEPSLVGAATEVVEAVLGAAYPVVTEDAARRFNALADVAPLRFVADATGQVRPEDDEYRFSFAETEHLAYMCLHTPTPQGAWVGRLALLFMENPHRDRLRRCEQCCRWFVDMTRNKSAKRCSRACTIAWSNKQRTKGGQ